ncbi:MAG: hypothetical protein HY318_07285 [Armatimonadetes bacterium]|nr:hypothetical protein [Armatimonadota bacterium]
MFIPDPVTTHGSKPLRFIQHPVSSIMSNPVIKVENLGKLYKIGARQERYLTLRDQIANAVASPFRRLRKGVRCQV